MTQFTERRYGHEIPTNCTCLLAADIGGTNSNFGIFTRHDTRSTLVLSLHTKSKEITSFTDVVKDLIELLLTTYGITITHAGFAVAGIISADRTYVKPTNLSFAIDLQEIQGNTEIWCSFLVNDFEVIGYGLHQIDPKAIVTVNKGEPFMQANKAILGAGTGLGKCILDWNKYAGRYIPVASEGGHADMAAQAPIELELIMFIQRVEQFSCNVSWEDVLSGRGIARIYRFFDCKECAYEPEPGEEYTGPHPDEIFAQRRESVASKKTFELYTTLYARCAKNFVLDALALNGIYIAGGIAAKNLSLFQRPEFFAEFFNCGKQVTFLRNTPVHVITDYNVSLYGVIEYMILEDMCSV